MSKCKRLAASLVLCAMLAALALPAGAVNSSFTDISDQNTAINADVLRLMGVVSGVGGDQFNPGGSLTRAEFCTMVIGFMQEEDQVAIHTTRTIFSDVTAKHWAAGYVNLAATLTVKDGEQSVPLVSGVGNGKFEPDAKITLAQAVTILIRVLGYSTLQTGAVWPQGYMNLAQSIGLTDGVSAGANDSITRAQTAQLFVNALTCKTGDGGTYYESLGQAKDDVVVLAVNVDTDDGSAEGAVRTSGGTYLPKEDVIPTALQGERGTLVLSDKNEIVAFVPDDSVATTVLLSGDAQPTYVQDSKGQQYTISGSTMVYTSDKEEGDSYANAYTSLYSGNQIVLFSERGKVVAVYAGGGTSISSDAVVVSGTASAAAFRDLTGGVTNFAIQKNRQPISLGNIKPNDVVTYDSLTNTLIVSDLRLTCVLERAYPSMKAPETVEALGHTFEVLESAWYTTKDFTVGKQVTLLLTADGKVAGMADPGTGVLSTAIGVVTGGGAEMFLPNGGSLTLTGEVSNQNAAADSLVTITSGEKGKIGASRLLSKSVSGSFDVIGMKLNNYTVTAGVRIFEQADGGSMVPIRLSDLNVDTIPGSKIETYHLNTSNMVDYIVLKEVTGSAYQYGMLVVQSTTSVGPDGEETSSSANYLINHAGKQQMGKAAYVGRIGSFVGIALGADNSIHSVIDLTEVKQVSPDDFFVSQGANYVTAGGKTYRVSDDVECYQSLSSNRFSEDNWFKQSSGGERLEAVRMASDSLTLYIDPIGQQVRIIAAN